MKKQLNVFGRELKSCSMSPLTGYFRNGCCDSSHSDRGQHTICAQITETFLQFSLSKGNDLITPRPEFNFDGLIEGDRWCLCLDRWIEAYDVGKAPKVILEATNIEVLNKIDIEILKRFALDIN